MTEPGDVPKIVTEDVLAHLKNASTLARQWTAALDKAQEEGSPCEQSPPQCLRIELSRDGQTFRIRNRCNEDHKGVIRVSCSGWAPDAAVEYRFSLGAKAEMAQESSGLSHGTCYYRHRLCAKEDTPAGHRPAALFPF